MHTHKHTHLRTHAQADEHTVCMPLLPYTYTCAKTVHMGTAVFLSLSLQGCTQTKLLKPNANQPSPVTGPYCQKHGTGIVNQSEPRRCGGGPVISAIHFE